tara:strand:- start:222 stop:443 length:222 start_codon:yes stop_codon:yes gene_type:complete
MILEALRGLAAIPRLVEVGEALVDISRAQMAQQRKDDKDKMVDDLIADARSKRLLEREAELGSGDSSESSERV